jgi:pimeloyl-ACP methyl ester carboxylesterase
VDSPDVRYAQSGDAAIAYYVLGEGPRDLVFAPFMISAVFAWELLPVFRDFSSRLSSFSRLILFDRRGFGASDRPRTRPTLEAHMEDVRAVLDAVGSEQAVLFGSGHGGQMCALFAATYPERTAALVLYATRERATGTEDEHRAEMRRIRRVFGLQEEFEREDGGYPSLDHDEAFRRAMRTTVRASTSPGGAVDFLGTYFETDISDVLPLIRVPTLVLYRPEASPREGPNSVPMGEADARRLAGVIPDARVVAIPGPDHSPFVGADVTNEVERYLATPHKAGVADRVLATVLFTDLVASTERIASLGDRQWREVLETHQRAVRRELSLYGESRSTRRAMDSSAASTVRPARSPVRSEWSTALASSSCRSGQVSIAVSARSSAEKLPGSRLRLGRGSPRLLDPAKCSSLALYEISSPARASRSQTEASTRSRVCPGYGSCLRSKTSE